MRGRVLLRLWLGMFSVLLLVGVLLFFSFVCFFSRFEICSGLMLATLLPSDYFIDRHSTLYTRTHFDDPSFPQSNMYFLFIRIESSYILIVPLSTSSIVFLSTPPSSIVLSPIRHRHRHRFFIVTVRFFAFSFLCSSLLLFFSFFSFLCLFFPLSICSSASLFIYIQFYLPTHLSTPHKASPLPAPTVPNSRQA